MPTGMGFVRRPRPARSRAPPGTRQFGIDHLAIDVEIPDSEIELRASRSSGPGGQHANVTASRIEAVFEIDGSSTLSDEQKQRLRSRFGPRVTAIAQDARSQARNRETAMARLRERIAEALRPRKHRRATRATRASGERRLASKRRRAEIKRGRGRPGADD